MLWIQSAQKHDKNYFFIADFFLFNVINANFSLG